MLWPEPGREGLLIEYENRVLGFLSDHGARLLTRLRASEGEPFEVQVLEFPGEEALDAFTRDPRRLALASLRDQAIARTELVRVERVDT
jgi:uncharacterized protein (DUF1330 family)